MMQCRANRARLEEAVEKLQKQFWDLQHDKEKCVLEIKVVCHY
jgi:hypothetical protein